jgi:hypothetical protein
MHWDTGGAGWAGDWAFGEGGGDPGFIGVDRRVS